MEHGKRLSLFRGLLGLRFDLHEKESPHENLTDILEIVAVAAGLKPAHVNGQGFRSEKLLAALETLALRHELLTLRTHAIIPHFHRPPSYDPALWKWQRARFKREAREGPDVLWVYKEADLANKISVTASGETDVSEVLGYPSCCVLHESEDAIRFSEHYVGEIQRTHRTERIEDLICLIRQEATVALGDEPLMLETVTKVVDRQRRSRLRHPFVQFYACENCLENADSPAARANGAMEALASSLPESFAEKIEKASRAVALGDGPRGQEALSTSRPGIGKIGRNDPCPCGSGKKFKRCHGGREGAGPRGA